MTSPRLKWEAIWLVKTYNDIIIGKIQEFIQSLSREYKYLFYYDIFAPVFYTVALATFSKL